jgi:alcohol dehydrogenase class IV
MRFEFATAARIVFGPGSLGQAGDLAAELGQRAFLVTGSHPERAAPLVHLLSARGLTAPIFPVSGEPTTDTVRRGLREARAYRCDLVIGMGGGSVLDTGKAVAALLTNGGDPLDYLEVIGTGRALERPSAPFLAIPTTSGTGAEVTRNAVLASPAHGVKVSLRSPFMLPRVALVDPELTRGLPPEVTASTGLDALTQLLEPYVSVRANPLCDPLCQEGMRRAARSLRRAFEDGDDGQAREDLALASLFGGLALANAGLGAVHGLAGPLGGMLSAPHGALCAALLPEAMAQNVRALRERQPHSEALRRYDEVARCLTGRAEAVAEDGISWITELCRDLKIPPLCAYGLTRELIPELVAKAAVSSSMKGNPIQLGTDELAEILERALGPSKDLQSLARRR